ncbi:hypothetical protein [Micromonospora sp. NPDC126480]|uniref:hypothetical protein n=1 Tax=Micromonospora sp. NPDC126480 TaxID=3155312 RepID=UPI00331FBA89
MGITYEGDHDSDGVVDVVELRFGSSPLLVDSDGDGLTDKFEITELVGWTRPNTPDSDQGSIADGAEDVDNDGLTNLQEQDLGTSPTNPDTDGDGLNDGAELARGTNPLVADQLRAPPLPGEAPPIETNPTLTDVDGDGLADIFEEEHGSDPANPDSDGDGLSDGAEVDQYLINPIAADTDGDGLRDDYELAHIVDQGLDPAIPDERVSKWTYVSDFLLGLFAGDFAPRDSMAWLSGYLCSGGLSLIPVVGWVLGGIADIRDTIAGVIHGDWVGAGLSIIGLVPYVGDAVAIPGKAAKFVLRYLHRLDPVIRFVARYDKIPDSVKRETIRLILLGNYGKLTDAGLSEAAIIRLAKGARTSLPRLADALSDPLHRAGAAAPWLPGATAGENWFASFLRSEGKFGARPPDTVTETPLGKRHPDYIEERPDGLDVAHEVKTGMPNYSREDTLKQCRKDGYLRRSGLFADVVWHFLPYGPGDSLGVQDYLLQCLREEGIPFTIHTRRVRAPAGEPPRRFPGRRRQPANSVRSRRASCRCAAESASTARASISSARRALARVTSNTSRSWCCASVTSGRPASAARTRSSSTTSGPVSTTAISSSARLTAQETPSLVPTVTPARNSSRLSARSGSPGEKTRSTNCRGARSSAAATGGRSASREPLYSSQPWWELLGDTPGTE